jgi:hypothetical protein
MRLTYLILFSICCLSFISNETKTATLAQKKTKLHFYLDFEDLGFIASFTILFWYSMNRTGEAFPKPFQ